jgi:alanyl-tRNA synthetase
MMKNTEIRNLFVDYFKKNGHTSVPSSSLIPENDPTLLFANAGMNQFKNAFLGLEKRDYTKAVSVQKCVRAGGKHNDLDNVGFTARHHTFFEMLGNFSFGDYFKKDAIHYAWEFLTQDLQIPKEKLYVTVFETDDEAADIWHKQESVPKDRIFRLGEKDNFWRMGDVGPCGPSSEIFFDHGPKAGKESDPYKGIISGEDRFVEIWNLVFMQFYEEAPGQLNPLPKPSVDTGSGFERVVAALQGQFANYDTDLFAPMIDRASRLSGRSYVSDPEVLRKDPIIRDQVAALRVLADHCRSTSFLLADGALPSNEGRGYVLRRIMRRAIRYGRKLSTQHSFLPEMSEVLISHMGEYYPELKNRKEHILSTIKDEESRFLQTLDNGSAILNDELSNLKKNNQKQVSGETLFKLYDTYGFPVDLTAVIAAEQGLQVDEAGFEKVMQASKEKAKSSWKGKSIQADEKHLLEFAHKHSEKMTKFVGYDSLHVT